MTITTTVSDVLSDIFIASIPICLLWQARISLKQKIGLAMVLCLSLVMALVAIVRVSGIRLPGGNYDIVWVSFWRQNECGIAVWMFSMTAFRSFFVARSSNLEGEIGHRRLIRLISDLKSFISRLFYRKSNPGQHPHMIQSQQRESSGQPIIASQDPVVPGPMLSNIRTAIDRAGRSHAEPDDCDA